MTSSTTTPSVRLPKGSLVFVTGATGLIGSATVEELVKRGYKVRAATRDLSKTTQFQEKLKKLYGDGLFEAVQIEDYTAPGAYEHALQGVDGVLHIATDVSFSSDVDKVVNSAVEGTLTLMKAANKVPSVKAFVLTSSRIAVYNPTYGKDEEWPLTTFSDYFYDVGKSLKDDDPTKPVLAYAASKVKGERAAWKYIEEAKPHYSFNTVLPDLVAGPISNPTPGFYSTASMFTQFFNGDTSSQIMAFLNPSAHIVDVRDVALIHVAALLDSDTDRQRLWAAAELIYHVNDILNIWREAYPDRKDIIPKDVDLPKAPKQDIDTSKSEELLQKYAGRSWIDTKTTVLDNVKGLEK